MSLSLKTITLPLIVSVSGLAVSACSTSNADSRYGGPVTTYGPCCEIACEPTVQPCGYVQQYVLAPPVHVIPEPPVYTPPPPPPPVAEEPPVYVPPAPEPCPPNTIRGSDGTCLQIELPPPPPPPVSWPEPETPWTPPPVIRK